VFTSEIIPVRWKIFKRLKNLLLLEIAYVISWYQPVFRFAGLISGRIAHKELLQTLILRHLSHESDGRCRAQILPNQSCAEQEWLDGRGPSG